MACCLIIALLLAVGPAAATSKVTTPALPSGSPALVFPSQTTVDGNLVRYLKSPSGDIDGVVLDHGAVALFPPRQHLVSLPFRKGDRVRVRGDVVGGLPGPILVRASVEGAPSLLSGMTLRPPRDWPEGLPAINFPDELARGHAADPMAPHLPTRTGKRLDDVLFARHPRLQQRTPAIRTTQWLKRLTSGPSHESEGHFNRRQEDDGP